MSNNSNHFSRKDSSVAESYIGQNTLIEGVVKFSKTKIKIDGSVDGKIESENSTVIVGEQGRVHAAIKTKELIVAGEVEGDLSIGNTINLHSSGSINGHVKARRIKVSEGAVLDGILEIGEGKE